MHTTSKDTPDKALERFQRLVREHYREGRRDLPWRRTRNPYRILVSEIMLQQTQVDRVVPKYKEFTKTFPTFKSLEKAPLKKVLLAWQGLGYNRRALYLKRIAEIVINDFAGKLPREERELVKFPGIGTNTAGAICAFAYNTPVVFIETNIRTVFLHHFFPRRSSVTDREVLRYIDRTLDRKNPREWYYALMDYGSHIKKTTGNASRRSKHYTKQSRFKGSDRELRGRIIKEITKGKLPPTKKLARIIQQPLTRVENVLSDLKREGFLG